MLFDSTVYPSNRVLVSGLVGGVFEVVVGIFVVLSYKDSTEVSVDLKTGIGLGDVVSLKR